MTTENEIKKLYVVKETYAQGKERIIGICTDRSYAEKIILDCLRKLYPFGEKNNLFELEEIENNRLWYRNTRIKIISIDKINQLIDWKE